LHREFRIHGDLGRRGLLYVLQLLEQPVVLAAEELLGRPLQDLFGTGFEYAQAGGVAGDDLFLTRQRENAVGHRLEHRLVVVLHVLHVGEQFGILQCDGDLRRERPQPRLVLGGKRPARLFSTWVTPMVLPCLLMIGVHRMERVKNPVFLSKPGLKRRSA